MKINNIIIKNTMWIGILVLLTVPFLQSKFNFIETQPLLGAVDEPEKGRFTFERWFSGEYQKEKEKYLNETFGFRSSAIRLNNQIAFSAFKEAKANGVVVGKKNYLYETNYIQAYYGEDYIGDEKILEVSKQLTFINDTLTKLNKNLILVFAAGKGSFFPEYIPDELKTEKTKMNYEAFVEQATNNKLSFIDFNRYFLDNKEKSKHPLYPQYGIHWSRYGAVLVADSLIRFIEKLREINMPNLYWDNISYRDPEGTDYDIADGMNILFRLKTFKMAYPEIHFESDSGKVKPSSIVVADSYYWDMFNFGISNVFSDTHFWYYNKNIYPDSYENTLTTDDIDLKEQIDNHDVFILLATEATIHDFGWGFIENVYNYFKGIN